MENLLLGKAGSLLFFFFSPAESAQAETLGCSSVSVKKRKKKKWVYALAVVQNEHGIGCLTIYDVIYSAEGPFLSLDVRVRGQGWTSPILTLLEFLTYAQSSFAKPQGHHLPPNAT